MPWCRLYAQRIYVFVRFYLLAWKHFLRALVSGKPIWLVGCHTGPFGGNAFHFLKYACRRPEVAAVAVVYPQARFGMVEQGLPWVVRGTWMSRVLARRAEVVFGTGAPFGNIGPEAAQAMQVMLWHGMPIKGIGLQCYPESAQFPEVDFCISTSPFTQEVMGRAFGMPTNRVLVCGEPKTDGFVDVDRTDVPGRLGAEYKKLVVYAPTYREHSGAAALAMPRTPVHAIIESEGVQEVLHNHRAAMVLALHPEERAIFKQRLSPPFFFATHLDVHTEHLLAAADYLISDYSSVILDWLVLRRPFALYVPDLEIYRAARTFPYFNYDKSFGPFLFADVEAMAEAMNRALSGTWEEEVVGDLAQRFHEHEAGGASERLFNRILAEQISI